jgi:ribosomal protein S12 methylthiotransferase
MMATFHLVSLGCAKNLVDSEVMLGSLLAAGDRLVASPEEADILIVNTCGFIQPAVEEAIEEILSLVTVKRSLPDKKIVVVGCLVQRYREQLVAELPEVDLFVGTEGAAAIAGLVARMGEFQERLVLPERGLMESATPRVLTTPPFRAWLKITEGCDNRCSYCMIPSIRGPLRSRTVDDLVREARALAAGGVKELSLIAQDTTAYGRDLGGQANLLQLLTALLEQTDIPWLRLLYLYPSGVTPQLLELMAAQPRILPYLDIPMQHVSDPLLRAMRRRYGSGELEALIANARQALPEVALRTTFLVGFPGEKKSDFLAIADFMRRHRLDHVGVFAYANEEGCAAENFPGQVPKKEAERRREYLLQLQAELAEARQRQFLGKTLEVLVEGVSSETELLLEGRTRFQAPDVDGRVYINEGTASPGDLVQVLITETQVYDLVGGIVADS